MNFAGDAVQPSQPVSLACNLRVVLLPLNARDPHWVCLRDDDQWWQIFAGGRVQESSPSATSLGGLTGSTKRASALCARWRVGEGGTTASALATDFKVSPDSTQMMSCFLDQGVK